MVSANDGVQVVIVGSIGIDDVETPQEKRQALLGGSVSYAGAAASFLSAVGMVGVVGDDFPEAHVAFYRRMGIDLAGLQRKAGKTFRWGGVYDANLIDRTTLFTELNVFESFAPVLPASYRKAPYVLLGNISPELQLHVLSECESPAFVIADTMNLWIDIARDALMEVIGRIDLLMLNDSEARLLTGVHNLRSAAALILAMGPRYVVIKKGEHGAMLFSKDSIFHVPAYPVMAVRDPTGAGDAFAGGFIGAVARSGQTDGQGIREGLLYGSVIASFCVQEFSVEGLASLNLPAIEARLAELRRQMTV